MAEDVVNIVVCGAGGRMGQMLVQEIAETEGCALSGATERPGSPAVGTDAGTLAGLDPLGVNIVDDAAPVIAKADAVIDFTNPANTVDITRLCAQAGAAHIIGTTGLSPSDEDSLAKAAFHVPVVYAPNMSVGVNLLLAMTKKVAAALGEDYDIEIVEMHHRHKVDAPSGTALGLGRAAAAGRDVAHDDVAILSREGHTGARDRGTIGYATLRGGDVVGDHSVIFAGEGERIEITHKASARRIYSRGAVRAALWTRDRKPGLYGMMDVLGMSD